MKVAPIAGCVVAVDRCFDIAGPLRYAVPLLCAGGQCSHDGDWRIPVAFRLWRPKRNVGTHDYRTKLQLAAQMLKDVLAAGLSKLGFAPKHETFFDTLTVDAGSMLK